MNAPSVREFAELRASVEVPGAKALELHAQLAEELADVIRRCEEQRVEFSQAIKTERLARISEASDLRTAVEESSADRAAGEAEARLRRELAEDRAQRIREAGEAKASVDSMVSTLMERTDELANQLATAKSEWQRRGEDRGELRVLQEVVAQLHEESAAVQRRLQDMAKLFETAQASGNTAGQALPANADVGEASSAGAPLEQVLALIRDAQDTMRFEFAARMAEVELKLQDAGRPSAQPRADADELATRLEAIKSQLRSEIEKRIERSPGSLPPPSVSDEIMAKRAPAAAAGVFCSGQVTAVISEKMPKFALPEGDA